MRAPNIIFYIWLAKFETINLNRKNYIWAAEKNAENMKSKRIILLFKIWGYVDGDGGS